MIPGVFDQGGQNIQCKQATIYWFGDSLVGHGEGNGNPLQYSCLENPVDEGAWWAAIYGVAQSRTRLKRLSSSSSYYPRRDLKVLEKNVAIEAALRNPGVLSAGGMFALPSEMVLKRRLREASILEWIYYVRSNTLQRFIFHKRVQNMHHTSRIWGERAPEVQWSSPVQSRTDKDGAAAESDARAQ